MSNQESNCRFVKVFDLKTEKFTTIPAAELAPGMLQVSWEGEKCWIDLQEADQLQKGPFRHPPFDERTYKQIRTLMGVFKEARPMTLKQWEDEFRRDMHPDNEIDIWLNMATIYEGLTGRFTLTLEQKKELLGLIAVCSTVDYDHIGLVAASDALPAEVVKEAIQAYYESSGETNISIG